MVFHQLATIPLLSITRYAMSLPSSSLTSCYKKILYSSSYSLPFFSEIEYSSLFGMVQSVDIVRYTDEEYEKHLTDPVGINLWLLLYNFLLLLNCKVAFNHSGKV